MPVESVIVVSAVLAFYTIFGATLAWVRWYAGGEPVAESRTPAE